MTDHIDRPPRHTTDGASFEALLRATLVAAAPPETHVEDRLADLRARIEGDVVVPVGRSSASRGTGRPRLLLTAAAILAVLGAVVGGSVLAGSGGPRSGHLRSGARVMVATGWYVPDGLPEGWSLESIFSDYQDGDAPGRCPCPWRSWASDDGSQGLVLGSFANRGRLDASGFSSHRSDVGLGHGTTGIVEEIGPHGVGVAWLHGGRQWSLNTYGLDRAAAVTRARSLAGDPERAPVPRGFHEQARSVRPGGLRSYRSVTVTLRNERRGLRLSYRLAPIGLGDESSGFPFPADARDGRGQIREVRFASEPLRRYGPPAGTARILPVFAGTWVGADLTAPGDDSGTPVAGAVSEEDVKAILGSLRIATARGWKEFAASAREPVDPELLVPTIRDLEQPVPDRGGD